MWEGLKGILTSDNAVPLTIIAGVLIIILVLFIIKLTKQGYLTLKGKYFSIGKNVSERELIRRQAECAHDFIMSIEGKIVTDTSKYNGYFTKYILERIYDKAIEWVMFNHITMNQLYIQDKQDTVLNLIYSMQISDEFKTPEFKHRVEGWTKELIEKLVNVKVLYGDRTGCKLIES